MDSTENTILKNLIIDCIDETAAFSYLDDTEKCDLFRVIINRITEHKPKETKDIFCRLALHYIYAAKLWCELGLKSSSGDELDPFAFSMNETFVYAYSVLELSE